MVKTKAVLLINCSYFIEKETNLLIFGNKFNIFKFVSLNLLFLLIIRNNLVYFIRRSHLVGDRYRKAFTLVYSIYILIIHLYLI